MKSEWLSSIATTKHTLASIVTGNAMGMELFLAHVTHSPSRSATDS